MRLSGTKTSSVNQYNGLGDQLYDLGGARPTLDLNFSSNESLVDSVTGKTLVDHTRQSSATYVDGDGVIRTAVTNLLLQSEDFSTTWLSPAAGIETNQILSPGGNLTADIIKEGANDTEHNVFQSVSVVAGSAYTISVYAKAKELSRIAIRSNLTGGFLNNAFNLSSNSVQREAAGYSCSIKQIGDGWYRCSATATANATGSKTVVFNLLEADITSDASPSYPGDGTSGIYLWAPK
jgi:hypothetical protein